MTLKEITILIADYSDYLVVLVAALSIIRFRKSSFFKVLTTYCLSLASLYTIATILARQGVNNWLVYHLIGVVEIVFAFILYKQLGLKKIWTLIFVTVLILYFADSIYVAISDYNELALNPKAEVYFVNHLGLSGGLLFILILGINFLWTLYKKEEVQEIGKYSIFYITSGITLYAGGAFFVHLYSSIIIDPEMSDDIFFYSWIMVAGLTYFKFILITIGLWYAKDE